MDQTQQIQVLLAMQSMNPSETEVRAALAALGLRVKAGEQVVDTNRLEQLRVTLTTGLLAYLMRQMPPIPVENVHAFVLPRLEWLEPLE